MICYRCHGKGLAREPGFLLCTDCGGSGIISCCDGIECNISPCPCPDDRCELHGLLDSDRYCRKLGGGQNVQIQSR